MPVISQNLEMSELYVFGISDELFCLPNFCVESGFITHRPWLINSLS